MTKVQLTLTEQEADILSTKASRLGYKLTRYVKFLVSLDAASSMKETKIPTFQMSRQAEKRALQAQKDHRAGKTIPLSSVKDLDNL